MNINKLEKIVILFIFTLICTHNTKAFTSKEKNIEIKALIDESLKIDEPGLAVGIVVGEQVKFTHHKGIANLDYSIPINNNTRFNLASNAKQYTALMILELEEQGKLKLSDDFRKYLPEAMPNIKQNITVHQLITHTSGIRDIYDLWALTGVTWYQRPFRNRDVMKMLNKQVELNFIPGSQFLYSNSNYILLAEMIAKITDQSFEKYATDFFNGLGMSETTVKRRNGSVVPNIARAYGKWSGWLEDPAIANMHGDGFLYTTLTDQLNWEMQVWGVKSELSKKLISKSQSSISGPAKSKYGYGLQFGYYRGLPTIYHTGSTGGYNAYTLRFPEQQTSIVILANTTQVNVVSLGNSIAEKILNSEFRSEDVFDTNSENITSLSNFKSHLGIYELNGGTVITLTENDGKLYREIAGVSPVQMIHESGNVYSYKTNPGLKLVLAKDNNNENFIELLASFQQKQTGHLIKAKPTGENYSRSINGSFINDETNTEIVVNYISDDKYEIIKNGKSRNATLIGKDYLGWNSYRMTFKRNNQNKVVEAFIDNQRIKNIRFNISNKD